MYDAVQGLIDGAYAAALDESLWPNWAWQAARLLGGTCGSLYVVEASGRIKHQTILHENIKAVERYMDEQIGRYDPQIPFVASLPSSLVYTDTDHLDLEKPETKEYLSWQAANGNLRHYVTAAARLKGGTHFAGLSVHRAVADGPTPHLSRRIMDRLLPDLHRALELGFLHAEKLTNAYWDGLLTQRQEPCMLLGEGGYALRMTPAMEGLLSGGDGLRCVQGLLTCEGGAADARLAFFIGSLLKGLTAPQACRIDRPSGKASYVVTGYPLPRMSRMLAPAEAVALITIVDPTSPPNEINQWRMAYALTAREAEFAALLLLGHSVDTAAANMGISSTTARVHLRNLFAKTRTNRQSELIHLLSRLSA